MNIFERLFGEVVSVNEYNVLMKQRNDSYNVETRLNDRIKALHLTISHQNEKIEELEGQLEKKTFVVWAGNELFEFKADKICGNQVFLNGKVIAYFDKIMYWAEKECIISAQ